MASNREEANRMRDMAERKFAVQDFAGAKECLLKAQQLFPALDGAIQMLTFLDARIAAHAAVTDADWIDIAEAVVRAEAAFKSIGEAFGVLSEKAKKHLHKSKRTEGPVMASPACASAQPTPESLTFWTACSFCRMQFQYQRNFLNSRMLCRNCSNVFDAIDISVHSTNAATVSPVVHVSGYPSQLWPRSGGVGSRTGGGNRGVFVTGSPGSGGTGGVDAHRSLAEEASLWAQQDRVDAERELKTTETLQLRPELRPEQRREEVEALRKERERVRALEETVQLLTKNQQKEEPRRKAALLTGRDKQFKKRTRGASNGELHDSEETYCSDFGRRIAVPKPLPKKSRRKLETKPAPSRPDSPQLQEAKADGEQGPSEESALLVPDPDFHDFDADRSEDDVKAHQVWAVFDERDGMPRFYCEVQKVNRDPFSVDATWVEPKRLSKGTSPWLKEHGFENGCGEFNLGHEINFNNVNTFSHLMSVKRYKDGYEIYPRRHEVWAVFRDYDKALPRANAARDTQLSYAYVFVRSDYSVVTGGGRVVKLEKLAGYRTLWAPTGEEIFLKVKSDLHRFSHRVPNMLVTEEDIQGVPGECYELDPASTLADVDIEY